MRYLMVFIITYFSLLNINGQGHFGQGGIGENPHPINTECWNIKHLSSEGVPFYLILPVSVIDCEFNGELTFEDSSLNSDLIINQSSWPLNPDYSYITGFIDVDIDSDFCSFQEDGFVRLPFKVCFEFNETCDFENLSFANTKYEKNVSINIDFHNEDILLCHEGEICIDCHGVFERIKPSVLNESLSSNVVTPNPFTNNLKVVESMMNKDIEIFDQVGNSILMIKKLKKRQLDLSNLDSGMYFIRIDNEIHKIFKY